MLNFYLQGILSVISDSLVSIFSLLISSTNSESHSTHSTSMDCYSTKISNESENLMGESEIQDKAHTFSSTSHSSLELRRSHTSISPQFKTSEFRDCFTSSILAQNLGHIFLFISLDCDTFCDQCKKPICRLDWNPVCQRCSQCHLTCHIGCVKTITVRCEPDFTQSCWSLPVHPQESDDYSELLQDSNDHFVTCIGDQLDIIDLSEQEVIDDQPIEPTTNDPTSGGDSAFTDEIASQSTLKRSGGNQDDLGQQPDKSETLYYSAFSEETDNGAANHPTPSSSPSEPSNQRYYSTATVKRRQTADPSRRRGRVREGDKTRLSRRYSFLAPLQSSTNTSRLHYDFSSLDQSAIACNGIQVNRFDLPPRPSQPTQPDDNTTSSSISWASFMPTTSAFIVNNNQVRKMKRTTNRLDAVAVTDYDDNRHNMVGLEFKTVSTAPPLYSWTKANLVKCLQTFNYNEFGLHADTPDPNHLLDCYGQVRVHINLLRPVRILLHRQEQQSNELDDDDCWTDYIDHLVNQPSSAVTAPVYSSTSSSFHSDNSNGCSDESQTIWIPRSTTRLVRVKISCTAKEMIQMLLGRFSIEDNPQKFALYEHTIEGEQEVSVRRLHDQESPLGLLLHWADQGQERLHQLLTIKRIVLQENDTGDIDWMGFSLPELETFLDLLKREEEEYRRTIELKYRLRRKEVCRLMNSTDDPSTMNAPHNGNHQQDDPIVIINGASNEAVTMTTNPEQALLSQSPTLQESPPPTYSHNQLEQDVPAQPPNVRDSPPDPTPIQQHTNHHQTNNNALMGMAKQPSSKQVLPTSYQSLPRKPSKEAVKPRSWLFTKMFARRSTDAGKASVKQNPITPTDAQLKAKEQPKASRLWLSRKPSMRPSTTKSKEI